MLKFNDGPNWFNKRLRGVQRAYIIPDTTTKFMVGVDVGANVGAFPVINNTKFNKIICIEPSESSFRKCKENVKKINNVEVHRFAVSKVSGGEIKLKSHKKANNSGNASTIESDLWDKDNYELVETISLLDIFKRFELEKIDYLKVDCEGGEYDFLMNQDLSNVDYIGIELHIQLGEKAIELENYLKDRFTVISKIGNGETVHKQITFKNKKI